METAIFTLAFILAIVAFFVCAAFAHAREKAYGELRESIEKLYNYISKEKRERDFLYGELEDKKSECFELRKELDALYDKNKSRQFPDGSGPTNLSLL